MRRIDFQDTDYSCGPAALQMLLERVGADAPGEPALMDELGLDMQGTHVDDLASAVERRGLRCVTWHGDVSIRDLDALLPDHEVMVCYQSRRLGVGQSAVMDRMDETHLYLYDPWFGPGIAMRRDEFMACWGSRPKGSAPRPRWLLAVRS